MINYEQPCIAVKDLVHGAYYEGECRNASVARWDSGTKMFYHWRFKFGYKYTEDIKHPEHDKVYDVFIPLRLMNDNEIHVQDRVEHRSFNSAFSAETQEHLEEY